MPRNPRIELPDTFYHVIARGDNREPLFFDDIDRKSYLHLLGNLLTRHETQLHAYCLMTNHVHLLFHCSNGSLSSLMERLHTLYAFRFNRRHGRIGHLFQKRFLSKVVLNETYLFQVCRYIHMNPVKAGIVENPQDYLWSSMRVYLGVQQDPRIRTSPILDWFPSEAGLKCFYEQTLIGTLHQPDRNGWPDAVGWYQAGPQAPMTRRIRPLPAPSECAGPLAMVARHFGLETDQLRTAWKDRRMATARLVGLWLLRRTTILSLAEIAGAMNYRSIKGMGNMLRTAEERRTQDAALRNLMDQMEAELIQGGMGGT